MKLNLIPALAVGLLAAAPAFSADIVIDFDGPMSFDSIGEYYNGDVMNYGVSFGLDALALQNDDLGPYFTHAPSPLGVMAPVGADATMNFATGFTAASFYYSSSAPLAVIGVYSGENGTGDLLSAFALVKNATYHCNDSDYCNWSYASVAFNGIAKSITFGDAAGVAGFDNLTISAVPEPSEAILMGLGLAGVMLRAARRKKAGA